MNFRLLDAFFVGLQFARQPEVPPGTSVRFRSQFKSARDEPGFTAFLRIVTEPEQPLIFMVELAGKFEPVFGEGEAEPVTMAAMEEFLNARGLFMLWPHAVQMVRQVTAQMGMEVVNLPTPYKFGLKLEEDKLPKQPEANDPEE